MDMFIELTDRERVLIETGLYILSSECRSGDLHYELVDDLGGVPDSDEVWSLKEKIHQKVD